MAERRRKFTPVLRAGARGLVAAMAMSGVRSVTANVGMLEKPPPQKIVEQEVPAALKPLRGTHRAAAAEVAHWLYGGAGGVAFGLLPAGVRAHPLAGPVYGLVVWVGFELGIAPMLGVQHGERRALNALVLGVDHVLYGTVVAGRLAPEPQIIERERGHPGSRPGS